MKGQSFVLTHSLFIGFSITFVLVAIVTLNALRDDYQEFIVKNEMKEVCLTIKMAVEKIYFIPSYTPMTNTTVGKIRISFPDRLADLQYRINFSGGAAKLDAVKFNETCVIGFNNTIGYTTGGETEIIVRVYSNETRVIEMIKI